MMIGSDFQVTPDRNIFRVSTPVDCLQKVGRVSWNVFSAVIFPVGLTRLVVNNLARRTILPACSIWNIGEVRRSLQKLQEKRSPSIQAIELLTRRIERIEELLEIKNEFLRIFPSHQVKVTTADGCQIDTFMILNPNQLELECPNQKWIIFLNPNAACYEEMLDYLKRISDATGTNLYTGNYRGVMESEGLPDSTHDLVLDVEAMVQKLLASGVLPENILVHGWSIGGGVSTEVAAYHQELDHEMSTCSDRSLSSLIDVSAEMMPRIGGLMGRIAWLARWKFNNVDKFREIKPEKRIFIVAKSDGVIPHPVSHYKKFKMKFPDERYYGIKMHGRDLHCEPLSGELLEAYAVIVKEVLKIV